MHEGQEELIHKSSIRSKTQSQENCSANAAKQLWKMAKISGYNDWWERISQWMAKNYDVATPSMKCTVPILLKLRKKENTKENVFRKQGFVIQWKWKERMELTQVRLSWVRRSTSSFSSQLILGRLSNILAQAVVVPSSTIQRTTCGGNRTVLSLLLLKELGKY